jgi:hypothetical protein
LNGFCFGTVVEFGGFYDPKFEQFQDLNGFNLKIFRIQTDSEFE